MIKAYVLAVMVSPATGWGTMAVDLMPLNECEAVKVEAEHTFPEWEFDCALVPNRTLEDVEL